MFSKATEYALRATIYIAQKSTEEKKLGLEEIARAIDSPQSFTAKILQSLTREKIVSSARGPNGGFFLSEIQPCPMHSQYKSIKKQLIKLFVTKTIKQLAADIKDGVVFIKNK